MKIFIQIRDLQLGSERPWREPHMARTRTAVHTDICSLVVRSKFTTIHEFPMKTKFTISISKFSTIKSE